MTLTIWQDLKHRKLLPVKVLIFLTAACDSSFQRLVSLHLKTLGITSDDIGIILAVAGLVPVFLSPLIALTADKISRYKLFLNLVRFLMAVSMACLLLVPSAKDQPTTVTISCPHNSTEKLCNRYSISLSENVTVVNGTLYLINEKENDTRTEFLVVCSESETFCSDTKDISWSFMHQLSEGFCELASNSSEEYRCTKKDSKHSSYLLTLFSYMFLKSLYESFRSVETSITTTTSVQMAAMYDAPYAMQRIWEPIGTIVMNPIIGYLMTISSTGQNINFIPLFATSGVFAFVMIVFVATQDLDTKFHKTEILPNLKLLLRTEVVIVLIIALIEGIGVSFSNSYTTLYYNEMKATPFFITIAEAVQSVASLAACLFAYLAQFRLTHVPTIGLTLLVQGATLGMYSLIQNYMEGLPLEAINGLCVQTFFLGISQYMNLLAKNELMVTMQAGLTLFKNALGKTFGNLGGGFLVHDLNYRTSYVIIGSVSAASGLLYTAFYFACLRKRRSHTQLFISNNDESESSSLSKCSRDSSVYGDSSQVRICRISPLPNSDQEHVK